MKQRLGKKKHKRCEQIASKEFSVCYTRGGRAHYVAQCFTKDKSGIYWVNYKTGEIAWIADYLCNKTTAGVA